MQWEIDTILEKSCEFKVATKPLTEQEELGGPELEKEDDYDSSDWDNAVAKTGIWGKNVSLSLNFKQKKKSTKPQGSSDIIYT